MANYRIIMIEGKDGMYLCNPSNLFEACKLAWMLWRNPEKASALLQIPELWVIDNLKLKNHEALER